MSPTVDAAPATDRTRSILAFMLVIVGVALLALVGVLLASGLTGGYKYYNIRGSALLGLAIQDLTMFSPLIGLAVVLFFIAARMARPRA